MLKSPDGSPVLLRIENVTKRFGDAVAVRSVSLDIAAGEFFSLLGPSGCGKTTLLRMIAGFEQPNEGRILLDGQDIAQLPPHKRPVNTVFQHYALFPHLSVRENVAFGLRRAGVKEPELGSRVMESLALVRLEDYGGRLPNQLSGGQRQRVALARALVMRPRVLLLDEPLGALDHQLRLSMQVELKALQRSCGITFLFVTHDQPEALTMSDRIAVLSQGVIEQHGPSREVYERPKTDFVARFMGASNLLPGKVTASDAQSVSVGLDQGPSLTVPAADERWAVGSAVRVMLRPEWLFLTRETVDRPGWHSWPVSVDDKLYQGAVTRWIVRGLGPDPLEVAGTPLGGERGNAAERPVCEDLQTGEKGFLVWQAGAGVVLRTGATA